MKYSLMIMSVLIYILLTNVSIARDQIRITGSSTVHPFSTEVSDHFGKDFSYKKPIVQSTGTGGGMKTFCAGIGEEHPDIVNASRRISQQESELCRQNGVYHLIEVHIGYDGIVFANSKRSPKFNFTLKDIYTALADQVPSPYHVGNIVKNHKSRWSKVNTNLPDKHIWVIGPPKTSGTRDAFEKLIMEPGCSEYRIMRVMKNKDISQYNQTCHTIRQDGAYIESGEDDERIVSELSINKSAIGIFGYGFLSRNQDTLQGSSINGIKPHFDNIANGSYPGHRPLFVYVKKQHLDLVDGIREYIGEFISSRAIGEKGYLVESGLIPLNEKDRQKMVRRVQKALR
ncbi:MAG: substrate-binding domain-containing protein [Magnetococcales bacterium]|nr:substrate-binding domain-containing protein [Magnetococcales bacterium]